MFLRFVCKPVLGQPFLLFYQGKYFTLRFRLTPVVALGADWFSLVAFNIHFIIIMISYLGTAQLRGAARAAVARVGLVR